MRNFNEENERIKRRYLQYLREAKRQDQTSVDKAASAILRFEAFINYKPFKRFHLDQAIRFKRNMEKLKNSKTGKPLSKSTIESALRLIKAFVFWLAGQSGYKSRISYSDAEYFNLNAKDARVAHAERETPYPTMAQARHAFDGMPNDSDIERRNKAIFSFLMLTGARDGAISSVQLKRIDLNEKCFYQDARDVRTKNAKTFTTWFLPVDDVYHDCFESWVCYLRNEKMFGHDDALFPKPERGISEYGGFVFSKLSRHPYSDGSKVREVVKEAFIAASLPAFGPHSFRKTLVLYGDKICETREKFKAWSRNIGHDSVVTSVGSYLPISSERQAELIKAMR